MRKIDKKLNLAKANLLAEQRYLASKGLVSENLDEEYYESREEPMRGKYIDSNELVGKTLFFHTNRSNRNASRNGMIGIYGVTSGGRKTTSPLEVYTNEVKIADAKFFASDKATAATQETGERTVHAGVTGTVLPLDGMGSGIPADYNPFDKDGASWFYLKGDPEKKEIISADEVYFLATEGGDWKFLVKGEVFGERRIQTEADKQTSMEFPSEEPELAEDIEKNRIPFEPSPMLNDLVIVKTQTEYILVNKMDNKIEAELGPINAYKSKEHLCTVALRLHSELFESYKDVYEGGGEILGPLSACKKGGLEEDDHSNVEINNIEADLEDFNHFIIYSTEAPHPVVAEYKVSANPSYKTNDVQEALSDVELKRAAVQIFKDGRDSIQVELPDAHYAAILAAIEKDINFGYDMGRDSNYLKYEELDEPEYDKTEWKERNDNINYDF